MTQAQEPLPLARLFAASLSSCHSRNPHKTIEAPPLGNKMAPGWAGL